MSEDVVKSINSNSPEFAFAGGEPSVRNDKEDVSAK